MQMISQKKKLISVEEHVLTYHWGAGMAQWLEHSPQFHQCGPGSIPGLEVIYGLSLLLVLVSALRGFSPGTPVFPSPQKPTLLNSNSIRKCLDV